MCLLAPSGHLWHNLEGGNQAWGDRQWGIVHILQSWAWRLPGEAGRSCEDLEKETLHSHWKLFVLLQRPAGMFPAISVPLISCQCWLLKNSSLFFFFPFAQDTTPCGIIPLENLRVRDLDAGSGYKYRFELFNPNPEIKGAIKAAKTNSEGKIIEGSCWLWLRASFVCVFINIHKNCSL